MDVIPIYIHDDDFALPFTDIIDYSKFCIMIHVNDLSSLYGILKSISKEQYNDMLKEMQKVKIWFTMEGTCEYIKNDIIKRLNMQNLEL